MSFELDNRTIDIVLSHITPATKLVIELGSGVSTVAIARALPKGARLISLEEEARFFDQTMTMLKKEKLQDRVSLHFCPIGPTREGVWYTKLPQLEASSVDLLVIDGPCSNGYDERAASVFVLDPYLKEDAVIVVDDAYRDADAAAMKKWWKLGWYGETIDTERGCAVLRKVL